MTSTLLSDLVALRNLENLVPSNELRPKPWAHLAISQAPGGHGAWSAPVPSARRLETERREPWAMRRDFLEIKDPLRVVCGPLLDRENGSRSLSSSELDRSTPGPNLPHPELSRSTPALTPRLEITWSMAHTVQSTHVACACSMFLIGLGNHGCTLQTF